MTGSESHSLENAHRAVRHNRYHAPALDKGLDILELLAGQADGLSRTEMSTALGRNPSEIYRMVERLVSRGYVHRASGGDRYHLSSKIYRLAMQHPALRDILDTLYPEMTNFVRAVSQSAFLGVFHDGQVRVVATYEPPDRLTITPRIGAELGVIDTAPGLALLAFQGVQARIAMLRATQRATLDERGLTEIPHGQLNAICRMGYARISSLSFSGLENMSFPLLDRAGNAIAVITCPFLEAGTPIDRPSADAVCVHLLAISHAISNRVMR
ncbi:IclR family transcriptional regulator [Burkholderia stabilis]|uniref:IclR family transcriptional regulator n=1 Tax=Burkholderia stabilis TaxID=95485 RepID=A0A4Q2A8Z3_9BURK|nr:IclR family transcriptional regulator [Burkholderia stabilis]RXV65698.1 IclR family transcriptional regulator [Burkholderia stabilis]